MKSKKPVGFWEALKNNVNDVDKRSFAAFLCLLVISGFLLNNVFYLVPYLIYFGSWFCYVLWIAYDGGWRPEFLRRR